jgi:hypothetical protein
MVEVQARVWSKKEEQRIREEASNKKLAAEFSCSVYLVSHQRAKLKRQDEETRRKRLEAVKRRLLGRNISLDESTDA